MKKVLLTIGVALLAMASQAQIKIQQTGQVSLSTISSSLSQGYNSLLHVLISIVQVWMNGVGLLCRGLNDPMQNHGL